MDEIERERAMRLGQFVDLLNEASGDADAQAVKAFLEHHARDEQLIGLCRTAIRIKRVASRWR
jgi:hypothetical protein